MNSVTNMPRRGEDASACYAGDRLLSVQEALETVLGSVAPAASVRECSLLDALGRVLAADVIAALDVPGFDNSAVDGYAVCSADTRGEAPSVLEIDQRIAAGEVGRPLRPGRAARIFTGAPIPEGADAVAMQEDCELVDGRVRVGCALRPGDNLRPRGQNLRAGQLVLAAGTRLRPQELGLVASLGIDRVQVRAPLRVAVLSTGDELALPGQALGPGQSYTANNTMLAALLKGLGCEVLDMGIVADDLEVTCEALRRAGRQADLVISSGGVSVGEEDYVRRALEATGSLRLWRIAMRPGKPLAFGRVSDACFLGLPGNPVSSLATFLLFARPLILRLLGASDLAPPSVEVEAGFEWSKPQPRREYARARLEGGVAVLHPNQSSDVLSSAVWAQGLVEIPEGHVVRPGQRLRFLPFSGILD